MKKLAELRAKLADLKKQALAMLDKADAAGGFDQAAQDAYDAKKAEIEATQADIAAAERLLEERRAMDALPAAGENTVHDTDPAKTHGFKDIAEFASCVRQASRPGGQPDARLFGAPTDVHIGGAPSGEGYEVPPEYRNSIFEVVNKLDEFGPLVDEEPTAKREVKGLADETTPWGATGVQARWRGEGTKMEPSKLVTEPRTTVLHELYAFVLATEELLEDAPRLASRITNKAGQAIAWKKNSAMVYGTGVGQPLGWMNSKALVTIPKESGQVADTIVPENIIKMFSRLLTVPGDAPFWITNSDCLPSLMTMTIGDRPIWMPPNGLVDAPGGFILGRPVKLSEHAKTVGDKGDIQLVSPKGYYAARRENGPKFAQSMHLYFDYAIEAFRWTFRFGGQPHLSNPVSPANGSATKSHFIAVENRA
ncbi:phage major capsid protein [Gemmobacter lutimaris]|uniref:Phage major capsid protein n=1 Tax=Gemmobacter lutimaris TaxID=2306023 RepID=A0A398BW63_9RHOB|nr:phage major capsid protein [Gemmobacter lutimaris]RID91543.1 phage major capsid protein [Gemmobacter lutimaris]